MKMIKVNTIKNEEVLINPAYIAYIMAKTYVDSDHACDCTLVAMQNSQLFTINMNFKRFADAFEDVLSFGELACGVFEI